MSKKLNEVQIFYLESHKDKLSVVDLAQRLGCTTRTVYNYLNRFKGEGRTPEGRAETKEEPPKQEEVASSTPTGTPSSEFKKSLPPPGLTLVGRRRGAVVMTEAQSEIGDEVFKSGLGKTTAPPAHIFIINPDKENS